MQQSASQQQAALDSMTRRCSDQDAAIKALESKVEQLEQHRQQLQQSLDGERGTAQQANEVSANLDRMYKSLKKQADEDKAYAEVCCTISFGSTVSTYLLHLVVCIRCRKRCNGVPTCVMVL